MRKIGLFLAILGAVVVGLVLAGCAAAPPEITPAVPPPTPAIVAGAASAGAETAPDELARFPMPAPEREEIVRADNSNCIACHTDEAKLQALAEEPEEVHLSEGEG